MMLLINYIYVADACICYVWCCGSRDWFHCLRIVALPIYGKSALTLMTWGQRGWIADRDLLHYLMLLSHFLDDAWNQCTFGHILIIFKKLMLHCLILHVVVYDCFYQMFMLHIPIWCMVVADDYHSLATSLLRSPFLGYKCHTCLLMHR